MYTRTRENTFTLVTLPSFSISGVISADTDTVVEATNDMFSIKTKKIAAYSQKPFSSYEDPRLSRVTTF